MFENMMKHKTLVYGGGIVAIILVFLVLRNATGSTASTTVTTTGPTDAQVQQQTTLALAQLDSATQANATNAQLTAAQMQIQADLTKTGIEADLSKYSIDKDSQNQQLQIQAQQAQTQYLGDLSASVTKWQLDNAAQMQQSNNSFQLDYAQAANHSAETLAAIGASVTNHQIDSNAQVTVASLASQAAQLASYLGAQVSINDSNNSAQVAQAQISSDTQKHGQTSGLLGSIIGGALSIFSDPRLKSDVSRIGERPDGIGVYSYRYHGDKSYQIGVMADEVARLRPDALGPEIDGYATVHYSRL